MNGQSDSSAANKEANTAVCIRHDSSLPVSRRTAPCARGAARGHCCAPVCRAVIRTAMLLRDVSCVLAMGCVLAVLRVSHTSKNYRGFHTEGFIGVGGRGKYHDREKPSRVSGFRLLVQLKNRKIKVGFRFEKPTKTDRKDGFLFSVHNTDCIT